jgi:GNAT superfamily N-acetyltransferase
MSEPRALSATDLPAAQAMSEAVGWPHRVRDWALLFTLGEGVAIEEQDGTLAATGMWWPHGPNHATIGMVLVRPDRQGRGLGRRVMHTLLEAAAPRALMLHATAPGLPLYAALGFTPAGEIHQYQGRWTGSRGRAPGLRPAGSADLVALMSLDAAAFGAPRLATLSALLADGTVVMAADRSGFAAVHRFGRGRVIGPVVAADEAAALAMIRALARPGAFIRLDIPTTAGVVAQSLSAYGLARVDTVTAMTSGAWHSAGPPHRYALATQGLG